MSDNEQQIIPPSSISSEYIPRQSSFEGPRNRGKFLTIVLLLLAISGFQEIFSILLLFIHPLKAYDRSIFPFITITLIVIQLIATYGIWSWKKWGVKLFVIGYIVGMSISILNGNAQKLYSFSVKNLFFLVLSVIAVVIVLVIYRTFYLEIKKRWHYFS